MKLAKLFPLIAIGIASLVSPRLFADSAQQKAADQTAASVPKVPILSEEGRAFLSDLMKQMDDKATQAQKYADEWAIARWASTIMLITFTAVVAAEKSISSVFTRLSNSIIPTLAVVVAILTAFDQTTKPGTRWRLSADYASSFAGLKSKARLVEPTDRTAIAQVNEEFQAMIKKWLDDTTF